MEYMSNLNGGNLEKPSLFEIVAQTKLNELIEPAIRHFTSYWAYRYPRRLIRILNYHEEFYALGMLFVERHYLKNYGGTFAEHFFGIKRERTESIKGVKKLTKADIFLSALVQVTAPLLINRSKQYYQKVAGSSSAANFVVIEDQDDKTATKKEKLMLQLKKLFIKHFPRVYFLLNISNFAYYIGYMFDITKYSSFILHILGLKYNRLSATDYQEIDKKLFSQSPLLAEYNGTAIRYIRNLVFLGLSKGLDGLKYLIPMSIFFYKFLDWWYKSDFYKSSQQSVVLPPPPVNLPHPEGIPLPSDFSICAICLKKRTNACAIPSGYLYCYPCIYKHLLEHGQCPVTLKKAHVDQIIKIYATS